MERIGEYEVERLVGEGGMGKVYEACERLTGRRVALKVLRSELSRSENGRRLFLNEMRILANLEHPAIVRSLASFEADDDLVLVLEFLDGTTLRQQLLDDGALGPVDAITVATRVASALAAAHTQKEPIIHRDLKPDNIMLCGELRDTDGRPRDGAVKVMDFGIAKVVEQLTQTHTQSVGTLQYMSPEQIDARQVDARSDIYSLGLVLYEMLTGAPPFSSPSPRELLNLQCTAKPPTLSAELRDRLPDGLEALLLRMLAKDPDDRPETADEVERRLTRILGRAQPDEHAAAEAPTSASPAPERAASPDPDPAPAPQSQPPTPASTSASQAEARAERSSGLGQMLLVAGVAFALGALVLFLVDPLSGRRDDTPNPSTDTTVGGGGPETSAPPETLAFINPPSNGTIQTNRDLPETHDTPDGAVAQLVRAGGFLLGTNAPNGEPDERPQKRITLGDYYLDATEVTVAAYRQCVDDGTCSRAQFSNHASRDTCNFGAPGRDQAPMNCVTAAGAEAFCAWRSGKDDALDYRLPTEAEWERAARGVDGRTFPWGEQVTTCGFATMGGCGHTGTGDVATTPSDVSPAGIMDLGGRVSEWVLAVYDQPLNPADLARPDAIARNLRGGNWRERRPIRAADRDAVPVPLDFGTDDIGFRCAGVPTD